MSKYGIARCHASIVQHGTVAGSSSDALQTLKRKTRGKTIVTVFVDKLESVWWQKLVLDPQFLCFSSCLYTSILGHS